MKINMTWHAHHKMTSCCHIFGLTFQKTVPLVATLLAGLPLVSTGMTPISDAQLASVTGQSLLVTDYIAPSGAAGGPRDFGFYRMGLDAEVALNMNIDKLQLGCGGFNETALPGSCDIDMDYVRFMGRYNGSGSYNPNQFAPGYNPNTDPVPEHGNPRAGDPATSSFILHRPYIELAIKEGNTTTLREVAGVKVSAEWADGFFGVGRYDQATDTHTGINTMSGFLDVYLSGYVSFESGLGDGSACIGRPTGYSECSSNYEFFHVPSTLTSKTRMTELYIPGVELKNLHGADGLLSLFSGSDLYAQMRARLIELHGFEIAQAEDFFVSFQREAIEYPTYAHSDNGGQYSQTANLGWWMNVPRVELKDLTPATVDLGCPGFACLGLLSAFSYPGIDAGYPDMQSRPPSNCYGNYRFC